MENKKRLASASIEKNSSHAPSTIAFAMHNGEPVFYLHGSYHVLSNWYDAFSPLIKKIKKEGKTKHTIWTDNQFVIGENFGNESTAQEFLEKLREVNNSAAKLYEKYLTDDEKTLYENGNLFDSSVTFKNRTIYDLFNDLYPEIEVLEKKKRAPRSPNTTKRTRKVKTPKTKTSKSPKKQAAKSPKKQAAKSPKKQASKSPKKQASKSPKKQDPEGVKLSRPELNAIAKEYKVTFSGKKMDVLCEDLVAKGAKLYCKSPKVILDISGKSPKKAVVKKNSPKTKAASKGSPKKATKKATPKKATQKKATPKKATQKKATKKATPKKATPKKTSPKKATPKKATPKKATPKKAAPKKAVPKKAVPKKAVAKKAL